MSNGPTESVQVPHDPLDRTDALKDGFEYVPIRLDDLAKFAERLTPAIRKEGALLLEKK